MACQLRDQQRQDGPIERVDGIMSDAASLTPKRAGIGSAERARLLSQIASALDLPVTAFTCKLSVDEAEGPSSAECAAMLSAFSRIRDPQMRDFCLQVLKAFAQK